MFVVTLSLRPMTAPTVTIETLGGFAIFRMASVAQLVSPRVASFGALREEHCPAGHGHKNRDFITQAFTSLNKAPGSYS
jgi:hypothetical protein